MTKPRIRPSFTTPGTWVCLSGAVTTTQGRRWSLNYGRGDTPAAAYRDWQKITKTRNR